MICNTISISRTFALAMLLLFSVGIASAQNTAFTYQGRLQDGGTPANGSYDFQFTLWDALSGGTQQPQPSPVTVTKTGVSVANGVFTVQLDFGASAFPGADRWLETSVRLAGGGAFTVLSPRQPITSTPYAVRSASSSSSDVAATATNATQLGGVAANQYVVTTDSRLSDPRAPTAGSSNYIQNTTSQQASSNFNISGNGTAGGTLTGNIISANQYNIGAGRVLATPQLNLFVGLATGNATTGDFNTFVGSFAGVQNTSGQSNTFAGHNAGQANLSGNSNSFFGLGSGFVNSTGSNNSYFGASAGLASTGSNNSFFGNVAGTANMAGSSNTAIGANANFGSSNLTNATAIGFRSLVSQDNSLVLGSIAAVNGSAASTNVGIGTAAPTSRLHVVGDTNLQGNLTVSGTLTAQLAVPLQLSGNVVNQGIISGINTNSSGAGIYGRSNLTNAAGQYAAGVFGENIGIGNGVYGLSNSTSDVDGGVTGEAPNGDGVIGRGGRSGVFGLSTNGNGVSGQSGSTNFAGVAGFNGTTGSGVFGQADNGRGIWGLSNNGFAGYFQGTSYFSGNVGVGTTSPAVAFEVRRNSTVASDWQTGQLRISGASNPNMQLSLGYDTLANLGVIQAGQAFTGFKTLSLNPSGGAVGIGTPAPDQTLTVNGGASKPGGGSWLAFSDERLKNVKGRFTPGLKEVMQLQPIRYLYKPDNALGIKAEGEQIGFGAQAVQKIIPEAVTRDQKGYLLVNNDPIMWTMLNAIKEQQAQIEQQHQQIEALKKLICRSHRRASVCK